MNAQRKPKISVIIPAYNEEKYIEACLESLKNQNIDKSLYEIVVVDNASTDNTSKIAQKTGARVVVEPKKGNAYARDRGVKETKGEIVAFSDADTILPKNWLSSMLTRYREDPKLDAIGGVFTTHDGSSLMKKMFDFSQPFVWHLSGGNMSIKRKTLEKMGGFTKGSHAGEDVLLSIGLQKEGKMIIDKKLIASTSSRRYSDNFAKTIILYFLNDLALKFFKKPLIQRFPDVR